MYYKYCQRCGRPSNGYPLCKACYTGAQKEIEKSSDKRFHQKYDKNNKFKCKCGIYVKSQGERTIADFLYENKICFEYEPSCRYGEYDIFTDKLDKKIIHPDFFIKGPTYFKDIEIRNVYIEFWGKNNDDYIEKMEYKLNVYAQHSCTLINLYPEDLLDYRKSLGYKLTNYEENEINFEKSL